MKREGVAPKAVYSVGKFVGTRFVSDPPRKTVALYGIIKIVQKYEPFWGPGKDFEVVLKNPTYGDLYEVASQQIKVTGDWHHIYFEGVRVVDGAPGKATIELVMGS